VRALNDGIRNAAAAAAKLLLVPTVRAQSAQLSNASRLAPPVDRSPIEDHS
jgi:hypothetical protein